MEYLPDEVWERVFFFLQERIEFVKCTLVCKRWNLLIWNSIDFAYLYSFPNHEMWNTLIKMKRLNKLYINTETCFMMTKIPTNILSDLVTLKMLSIDTSVMKIRFEFISHLTRLESLSIICNPNIIHLKFILSLTNLRKLCLNGSKLSTCCFKTLSRMTNIQYLWLWNVNANDHKIMQLTTLSRLELLDISNNYTIHGYFFNFITHFTNLTVLDVSHTWIDEDDIQRLRSHGVPIRKYDEIKNLVQCVRPLDPQNIMKKLSLHKVE